MQLVFPVLVRASMFFHPCVPYSEWFFSPRREEGPETVYLCVFGVRPRAWRALQNAGDSILWH